MMRYFQRVWLAAWLLSQVVYASSFVGELSKRAHEPYHWTLPWYVLGYLAASALLGWLACLETIRNKDKA